MVFLWESKPPKLKMLSGTPSKKKMGNVMTCFSDSENYLDLSGKLTIGLLS